MKDSVQKLTFKEVATYPRPGSSIPTNFKFLPDGKTLTFLQSEQNGLIQSLWSYDLASGTKKVIAGPKKMDNPANLEEELQRERTRERNLGVTSYQVAGENTQVVLFIPGQPARLLKNDEETVEIPSLETAIAPRINRSGTQIAYVKENNLWVMSLSDHESTCLTHDGEPAFTNGLADFISQEEFSQPNGFWWSPNGTKIAYIQADSRHIENFPIVHLGNETISTEHHRYPFAGKANPKLRLGIIDLASEQTQWIDLGHETDIYIPRIVWREDEMLGVLVLSRDQTSLNFHLFDPETGTATHTLSEKGTPWLNIGQFQFLDNGDLLWSSERTGFRHLYLYDKEFSLLNQVTGAEEDNWLVTRIVHVDMDSRLIYFESTRSSALERHLEKVSFDGGPITKITKEEGWHSTLISSNSEHLLDSFSSTRHAPKVNLGNLSDADQVKQITPSATLISRDLGLDPPIFLQLPGADGTLLDAALYLPDKAEASPLIISGYGGPHAQRVMNEWSLTVDLRAQFLVQQGFAVLKVDNRGSANRGLAFESPLFRNMGTIEIDDQVAALRALSESENIDITKVGIYGWSYGGYLTCMALMRYPDVFQVGVAGAPVIDWAGYDTAYTERYMQKPSENQDGYSNGSVLPHVKNLLGKLLIVHGLIDENVHFRHTARLLNSLSEQQKHYDLVLFPQERHMPRKQLDLEYLEARCINYLIEHLQ